MQRASVAAVEGDINNEAPIEQRVIDEIPTQSENENPENDILLDQRNVFDKMKENEISNEEKR